MTNPNDPATIAADALIQALNEPQP